MFQVALLVAAGMTAAAFVAATALTPSRNRQSPAVVQADATLPAQT